MSSISVRGHKATLVYERHGWHGTKEHKAWSNMWSRVRYECVKQYSDYGGRGISVCDEWRRFSAFIKDMGACPEGYELDRIDTNGHYGPSNCRWTDPSTQALNRRLFKRNWTGVAEITWRKRKAPRKDSWLVRATIDGKRTYLYSGQDFFEACCVRKSWEAKNGIYR
jgi:hypothetical protein